MQMCTCHSMMLESDVSILHYPKSLAQYVRISWSLLLHNCCYHTLLSYYSLLEIDVTYWYAICTPYCYDTSIMHYYYWLLGLLRITIDIMFLIMLPYHYHLSLVSHFLLIQWVVPRPGAAGLGDLQHRLGRPRQGPGAQRAQRGESRGFTFPRFPKHFQPLVDRIL